MIFVIYTSRRECTDQVGYTVAGPSFLGGSCILGLGLVWVKVRVLGVGLGLVLRII